RRLQERQVVPALEVAEEPRRDRHLLALDAVASAAAELGRDEMPEDLRVEGVAGERDALDAEALAGAAPARLGADAEELEVAGAAAEVGDEDELVLREAALVVVRRRDRLELEDQALLGKAGEAERGAQASDGVRVVLGRDRAGEAHRTADDDPG